jgi:hypothetical protein
VKIGEESKIMKGIVAASVLILFIFAALMHFAAIADAQSDTCYLAVLSAHGGNPRPPVGSN